MERVQINGKNDKLSIRRSFVVVSITLYFFTEKMIGDLNKNTILPKKYLLGLPIPYSY